MTRRVACAVAPYDGRDHAHGAGRAAAAAAVVRLLGLSGEPGAEEQVTVVPGVHEGDEPCTGSHRPVVSLGPDLERRRRALGISALVLSIAHDGGAAVAVVVDVGSPS